MHNSMIADINIINDYNKEGWLNSKKRKCKYKLNKRRLVIIYWVIYVIIKGKTIG